MSSSSRRSTKATPTEPSKMSSTASENTDYLTPLPTEILVKAISELPISNYLDIAHTCRRLRSVLKTNAAMICNLAIRSRYRFKADFLKSEMVSGWLVPTHKAIQGEEEGHEEWLDERYDDYCKEYHNHDEVKHFSILGEMIPEAKTVQGKLVYIKVSCPGPQYLHLLESDVLDICDGDEDKYLYGRYKCAAHYYGSLPCTDIFRLSSYDFWEFMGAFNGLEIGVKDGTLEKPTGRSFDPKFPRELVWYYSVDKLVLSEREEMAADKAGKKIEKALAERSEGVGALAAK